MQVWQDTKVSDKNDKNTIKEKKKVTKEKKKTYLQKKISVYITPKDIASTQESITHIKRLFLSHSLN